MITFFTNENNDICLDSNGNIYTVSDTTNENGRMAALTICEQVMKALRGEMIYSQQRGMPNFETVWSGRPNLSQFEIAARELLGSLDFVTGIISFDATILNNILSYTVVIDTVYGGVTLNA